MSQLCPNCGYEVAAGAKSCEMCGARLEKQSSAFRATMWVLFLVLGLPGLVLGSCLAYQTARVSPDALGYIVGFFFLFGIPGLVIFAAITALLIWSYRRR